MKQPGKRELILAIAAALMAASAQSIAQTNQAGTNESDEKILEEVLVTGRFIGETGRSALKSDVPLRDVPVTVSSYTDDFMKAIETVKLSDLYDYMTGVQRAGNTAYDINIRGFASGGADRNTLMVDGLPGLAVRFGSPPTISAERVEVVKGPASVLYGQVQPGGFVNIVTKKPEEQKSTMVRFRTESFYGDKASTSDSFGYTVSLDSTGPLGKGDSLLYRVIAQYGANPGFRDYGKDDDIYVMPSLTWNVSDDTSFTGFVEYRDETAAWDDGLVAPNNAAGVADIRLVSQDATTYYPEPGDSNAEKGTVLGLGFTHDISSNLQWRGNFRAVDHEDHRIALEVQGTRTCHASSAAGKLNPGSLCVRRRQRDQYNERTYYFGDTNLAWDFGSGNVEHRLLTGINWGEETADFKRNDFGVNNNTYDISLYNPVYGQGTPNAPGEHSWSLTTYDSFAIYLQDQISFGEQWKLLVGGRYEEFDIVNESRRPPDHPRWSNPQQTKGDAFVPMAGLLYQPNDSMTYYLSYSESFNPPAPGRLDANGNIFEVPEEGVQYEAGVKADLADGRSSVTFSVFQITKQNSLQQIGTTGVFQLTGEEESTGFEIETDYQLTDRWQVLAGYAYVNAEVKDDVDTAIIGQVLRNSPKHSASIWNRIELSRAFSLGVGVSYISERYGTIPDEDGNAARLYLPSYTLVDAALYYTNENDWGATLKLGNLLDEKYYPSGFSATRINVGAPANVTFSIYKTFY